MTNRPQTHQKRRIPQQNEPDDDLQQPQPRRRSGYQRQSIGEAMAKSFIRSIASRLGRIIVRSITGRMR
jgi:hypothetical protein